MLDTCRIVLKNFSVVLYFKSQKSFFWPNEGDVLQQYLQNWTFHLWMGREGGGGLKLLFILMMEKQWLFHDVNSVYYSWQRCFVFFMIDLFCIFYDVKIVCFSSLKLFHFFMVAFCCFPSTILCCPKWFSAL